MANDHPLLRILDPRNPLDIVLFDHTRCQRGWRVEPRQLPEDLIYVIEGGTCAGTIDGSQVQLEAGSAFWLPAGLPHHLATVPGRRPPTRYHLRVRYHAAPRGPILTRRNERLQAQIARLLDDHRTPLPDQELRIRAGLALLLSEFDRCAEDAGGTTLGRNQRAAVMRLVEDAPAAARLHPRQLARATGLAPAYFSRVFTRTYGRSPRSWLKQHRIERAAARLAESTASISEVAAEFGYTELYRFSRQFREVMGCSPRGWQRRHGAG